MRDSFRGAPFLLFEHAEVEPRFRKSAVAPQGVVVGDDGLAATPLRVEQVGQVVSPASLTSKRRRFRVTPLRRPITSKQNLAGSQVCMLQVRSVRRTGKVKTILVTQTSGNLAIIARALRIEHALREFGQGRGI